MNTPDWLRRLPRWSLFAALPAFFAAHIGTESSGEAVNLALSALTAFTLPWIGYRIFGSLDESKTTEKNTWIRWGMNRRRVFRREAISRTLIFLLAYVGVSSLVLLSAHSWGDPWLQDELAISVPLLLLSAWSASSLFLFASIWFGSFGRLCWILLAWVLGFSNPELAVLSPIGHLRHLLGLGDPLAWDPTLSSIFVFGTSLALLGLTELRLAR